MSIRVRAGTVAVAALLVLAPASAALALVPGAPTAVTHHMMSSRADEVRSPSGSTVDGFGARAVRHSWSGNGTDTRQTADDSDGGTFAGQDESGGEGSGSEDGSGQDESGGKGPGGGGHPGQAGSGDGDTGSATTTSTTTTTTPASATTAPPVTSTTAPASPAGPTDASDPGADEGSEAAGRTSTPAAGATSPTTTTTTAPPTDLRSTPAADERSSPGSSTTGGRIDVSEPDPALVAALAREESWSFLAGQGASPPVRPDLVEALDPAPSPSKVVLSWLVERNSTGASMAVLSPIVVLLTVWDAVASAGSGLAAPASALGTFVMLILFEKGHVAEAGARLLGRRTER